jgi:hypothetical protein
MLRIAASAALVACGLVLAGCSQTEARKDAPEKPPAAAPVAAPSPAPSPVPAPAPAPAAAAKPIAVSLEGFEAVGDVYTVPGDTLLICSNGVVQAKVKVPAAGEYDIVLTLSGDEAKNELPKCKVRVDGKVVGSEIALSSADAKPYVVRATLPAGTALLGIEFTNDFYVENESDRNLRVEEVVLKPVK